MVFMRTGLFSILAVLSATIAQDPCANHQVINEPHRSAAFVPATTDHLICDLAITPGWYSFTGNREMPNSCVQSYHCGTHAPVWLKGSFPTQADGVVNRQACINYGIMLGGSPCCHATLNIQVKNCGGFYVYYLVRTPGCSVAYCAGNQPVCTIGQFKPANHTCQDLYPKLTAFPELGKPEVDQAGNVRFACKIPYQTGEKDVGFDIEWTVDGKRLINPTTGKQVKTTLTGDQRIAYLDANLLSGNLGKTLRCNVTSYHPSTPLLKSDIIPSQGYWVGLRTSVSRLYVDEKGPEKEIELESTLPIPCHAINPTECKLRVELKASNNPTDVSTTNCVYELIYDPNTKTYKTTVKVKATRDFIDDHDKVHELTFRPIFDLNQPLWMNYKPPTVQLITKDSQSGSCSAHADPHFIGLDHKRKYNVYQVGDYVMYRSKNRKFEVQIRNWACGKYNPCICSVIAREGNDVVQVDMCEKRKNDAVAPTVKVLSQRPLDGTTIYRDPTGKKFYINFPSGARVAVGAMLARPRRGERDGYLNVDIQAPSDDGEGTEGLCGTFDHNPDNDFTGQDGTVYDSHSNRPRDFIKSWQVKQTGSLFDKTPLYDPTLTHQHHYCRCKHGMADCTKEAAKNPSKNICSKKCIATGPGNNNVNGRRETYDFYYNDDNHDDDILADTEYKPTIIKRKRSTFPTPSGMTYQTAQNACSDAFNRSTLYQHCATSSYIDIDSYIEACVEDMQVSDSYAFVLGSVDAFDEACVDVIMRNLSNYGRGANGEKIPPEILTSLYCPNQCNFNGTCLRGTCMCDHGYTSVDCSVQIGATPEIQRIRGDSTCDMRKHPCQKASVIVDNIMDVPELQCRYRLVTFTGGLPVVGNNYATSYAEFTNFWEVACTLPPTAIPNGYPVEGYMISITTDGRHYSAEEMFVVYDGLCQQCNKTGVCSMKNESCLIDGHCRRSGEENLVHQICQPSDPFVWSNVASVNETDYYTEYYTGCPCQFDPKSFNCACCKNGGCQCRKSQANRCTSCQHLSQCGKYQNVYP